jgi:hypothetical protein
LNELFVYDFVNIMLKSSDNKSRSPGVAIVGGKYSLIGMNPNTRYCKYIHLAGVLVALLFSASAAYAQQPQITFEKKADLPYRLTYAAYCNDGKYLYAANGLKNGTLYSTELLRYDTDADKWEIFTNKLNAKINAVAAFVPATHKIYIMGGNLADRRGFFYNIECVDTQTGAVSKLKVSNPAGAVNCGVAVWNNKIYIFGGFSEIGYPTRKIYEFDPATEKFTQLKYLPVTGNVKGAIVNGVLYTFGGRDVTSNNALKQVYAYDLSTQKYTLLAKLDQEIREPAISQRGSYIFLTGDLNHNTFLGYFNTQTATFTQLQSNMLGRQFTSTGIIGNMFYVYGGGLSASFPGMASTQATDVNQMVVQ